MIEHSWTRPLLRRRVPCQVVGRFSVSGKVGDPRADQARVDAVAALKAAEGASVFSATAPESPRVGQVWYELNAAGAIVGIHVWDGSAWLVRTLAAGQVLVPGSVGSTLIGPGSVTTREIDVDDLWAEIVRSRGVTTTC